MSVRFGEPSDHEIGDLENLFGARIEGELVAWQTASWRVVLVERFGFADVSAVVYRDKTRELVYLQRMAEAAEKAASDM